MTTTELDELIRAASVVVPGTMRDLRVRAQRLTTPEDQPLTGARFNSSI